MHRDVALHEPIGIAWIHGLFGAASDWDTCAQDVERTGDQARGASPQRRLSLPGHGDARPLRATAGAGFGAAATALWNQLPAERRWLLVGYSMGGRAALAMAQQQPGRCAGLVLVSGHPGLPAADTIGRNARRRLDQQRATELRRRGADAFLRSWYQAPLFAPWVDRVGLDAAVAARGHVDPEGAARCLERLSLGHQPRLSAAALLRRLDDARPGGAAPARILAVAGERDVAYAALLQTWATEAGFSDGRIDSAIVAGSGHAVHLEASDALAALVVAQARIVTER